ncbi:MAG: hypothetical protein HC862_06775 [Scytonema sp. RU_4_4]|nr:hypothetical protein [Scytonema sp. RU_4_4]
MNLPVVLDIALGLIFIYLILSLLTSEIQELISTLLQWRAKHLKNSIQLLLAGGSETEESEINDAIDLVHKLYQDPLINTLNQQSKERIEKGLQEVTRDINGQQTFKEKQSAPSYIPSETFATTLLETLKIPELIRFVKNPSEETETNLHVILSSYKELKTAINDKNSDGYQTIQNIYGDISENEEFKKLVRGLPEHVPHNLMTSLSVLAQRSRIKINDLKEEMNQFQQEVETWFDRSMDRTSGVYKRNAKGIAILIGISVAILTNTDTFFVLKRLSQDSAIRSAITQSAIQQNIIDNENARNQFQELLGDASVPIGWQNINQQFEPLKTSRGNSANSFLLRIWLVFKIIFGWIVSGLAIAMGAPFWFDILNKLINVRNTGPKPVAYTKDQPPEK